MSAFDKLNIIINGGSHEDRITCSVEGFPIGFCFSKATLKDYLERRSARNKDFATARIEKDEPIFDSGIEELSDSYKITSNKVEFHFNNENYNNKEYQDSIPRPSHADYPAYVKDGKMPIGGGRFSGRMTVAICTIGAIAIDYLKDMGITIASKAIYSEKGDINDSFGGIITCTIKGIKAGQLGNNLFDGIDGKIAYSIYGVPAVKGVEFGDGFKFADMLGSEANDELYLLDGNVKYKTNHNGGVLGGISNGEDIVVSAVIKPTSSIAKKQRSVNLNTMEECDLILDGRHDRCIVPRAIPCVESAIALAIIDDILCANK